MSFKQMREAREEAYGRKVPGIRAFFSFWCPLIFVLMLWNVIQAVQSWNGNSSSWFVLSLLLGFSAFAATALGRFWDRSSWISAIVFLGIFAFRETWDLISSFLSTASEVSTLNNAAQNAGEGLGSYGDVASGIVTTGINAAFGFVTFISIISYILFFMFVAIYLYIFIKNRRLFLMNEETTRAKEN